MKKLKAKMRFRILIACVFLLLSTLCKSQKSNKSYVELGSFINTIGLPFKAGNETIKLNRPLGIRISYGQHLEEQEDWYSNYEIAATFYRQRQLNTTYQIEGNYSYNYPVSEAFAFAPVSSLAYTHTFNEPPTYKQIEKQYVKRKDLGRSQISIALGFRLQYNLPQLPYSMIAQYQYILQLPFARKGGVWILPQNRIYLGLRRYLE